METFACAKIPYILQALAVCLYKSSIPLHGIWLVTNNASLQQRIEHLISI